MRSIKRWFIVLLAVSTTVSVLGMSGCKKKEEKKEEPVKVEKVEEDLEVEEPEPKDAGSEDFAIFGVDTRANNLDKGTRSDSIMVVHVDHNTKQVYVASVFRDCYVQIAEHGREKITHAHSYGGPDLALDTLNTNLDLDLDKYITVNFTSVADLIDDIDGVVQEITAEEVEYINSYITEVNKIRGTESEKITEPGTYNLDGTQAVAYSRIRYTEGGDYKRSERQRSILFSVFDKAKELETIEAAELVSDMLDEINTNYNTNDITELLFHLSEYDIVGMDAFPKVFYSGSLNGAWVEAPDTLVDMSIGLHQFLYPGEVYTPSQTVQEISNQITADRNAFGAEMGHNNLE